MFLHLELYQKTLNVTFYFGLTSKHVKYLALYQNMLYVSFYIWPYLYKTLNVSHLKKHVDVEYVLPDVEYVGQM